MDEVHFQQHGSRCRRLPEQGEGQAWAYTNFYVRPEWSRPMLSFRYNMYVNDTRDFSDFSGLLQQSSAYTALREERVG